MPEATRVGYVLRRFPVLSETFIQREICALREHGIDIAIFALQREPLEGLGAQARRLASDAHYLDRVSRVRMLRDIAHFARTRPRALAATWRRVSSCAYSEFKSVRENCSIFVSIVSLAAWAESRGVRLLHAPWAYTNAFIAMEAARLLGIPYSVHARAFELHEQGRRHMLAEKFARARFVVTNTEFNRQHVKEIIVPGTCGHLHVIRNGVETEQLRPGTRERSDTLRILTVARVVPQKGLEDGLRACARLASPFHWRIVGPVLPRYEAYFESLLRLRSELGLERKVTFVGGLPAEDALREYPKADVFLLPCVIERNGNLDIIPNALLEAMACGLPVVSTRLGGIPEIVDDGIHGLLTDPGTPLQLRDAIEKLGRDAELRRRMGDRGRARVEEKFNLRKNMASYAQLFRAASGSSALSNAR